MALPGLPECKDQASIADNKVECKGEDDCCGSIREWLEVKNTETGNVTTLLIIGRHDCETALHKYAKYDVLCSDHTDECVDVDRDSLPENHEENMLRAKICFCSGDLCNYRVPGLETTIEPEPTQPQGKQCYNCGYRQLPNGEKEKLPDVAECNDFVTPDDITVACGNENDCCAMLKEYFTTIDEDTGENSTVMVGRHGCESDLNHIGEQTVLCSDHTDACLNIDRSSLPNHQDHNVTVSDIEICFCSGDRCNAEDPIPPTEPTTVEPTTPEATTAEPTTPTGMSSYIVPSFAVLILALLC